MNTILYIQNLKCGGCEATIKSKLLRLQGVEKVVINHTNNTVSCEHTDAIDIDHIIGVLSKLGYPVVEETNSFEKKAKSYLSCAIGRIRKN